MDKINFTGLRNVGANFYGQQNGDRFYRMVMQLNNMGSKDLKEFKNLLKGTDFSLVDNDFLILDSFTLEEGNSIKRNFFLNEEELPITDATAKIFSKISDLNNLVINSKKRFLMTKKYSDSEKCLENVLPYETIDAEEKNEIINTAHSKRETKKVAAGINEEIKQAMIKYYS